MLFWQLCHIYFKIPCTWLPLPTFSLKLFRCLLRAKWKVHSFFAYFKAMEMKKLWDANCLFMIDCRCYLYNREPQNCFRLHGIRFQQKMLPNSNNFVFCVVNWRYILLTLSRAENFFFWILNLLVKVVSCQLLMVCILIEQNRR